MVQENLSVYVQDHLAGAVGALKLCERIERLGGDGELDRAVAALRAAIEEDRQSLLGLARALGIERSRLREAGARVVQAMSSLKLRLERGEDGELQLLHALDSLALGIEGKKALWLALRSGGEVDPRLRVLDYEHLLRRADEQLAVLRGLRIETARRAFAV